MVLVKKMVPESSDHTAITVYLHILNKVAEIFQHIESDIVSSSQRREMLFDAGCLHTLQWIILYIRMLFQEY